MSAAILDRCPRCGSTNEDIYYLERGCGWRPGRHDAWHDGTMTRAALSRPKTVTMDAAEHAALVALLKDAVKTVRGRCEALCGENYLPRGRHSPDCMADDIGVDDLDAALAGLGGA